MKVRAATSNNENGGCGPLAARTIRAELTKEDPTDLFVINCQETDLAIARTSLQAELGDDFVVMASRVKKTPTKMEKLNPWSTTGIGTLVVYKKAGNIKEVEIVDEFNEALGTNKGKGGLVTNIIVTDLADNKSKIQSTSGHLDSNHFAKRMQDYQSIRQKQFFQAKNWDELKERTPDLAIDGMDINTRSVMKDPRATKDELAEDEYENLWELERTDPRVAAIHLASGGDRHSAHATYKTTPVDAEDPKPHKVKAAGKNKSETDKRYGDVNTGSLDHITVSNSTVTPSESKDRVPTDGKYNKADIDLGLETGQTRDHHFLATGEIEIVTGVSEFEKIRNYVAHQLVNCAPQLSDEILQKLQEDTPENRALLLATHNIYLSPNGRVVNKIEYAPGADNVAPWFEGETLADVVRLAKTMEDMQPEMQALKTNLTSFVGFKKDNKKFKTEEMRDQYMTTYQKAQAMIDKITDPETDMTLEDVQQLKATLVAYRETTDDKPKKAMIDKLTAQLSNIEPRMALKETAGDLKVPEVVAPEVVIPPAEEQAKNDELFDALDDIALLPAAEELDPLLVHLEEQPDSGTVVAANRDGLEVIVPKTPDKPGLGPHEEANRGKIDMHKEQVSTIGATDKQPGNDLEHDPTLSRPTVA
jgi:hypothetical protein